LKEAGFKIVSLEIQVSQEESINAAIQAKADATSVSSLSGHAKILVEGLKAKCVEAGLTHVGLYHGAQLIIGDMRWEDQDRLFKEMRVDRVYPHNAIPEQAIADLKANLK